MIISTILLVSITIIPVAIAQEEANQTLTDLRGVSEPDYLQGRNLATPESVNISSAENTADSSTRMTSLALNGLQGTPAETAGIEWQLLLGGSYGDNLFDIQPTTDGGYIAVGATGSRDGNITVSGSGSSDAWVVKISKTGAIQWQKLYGGNKYDEGMSIRQTSDGGYVFAGSTASTDGEFSGNHGVDDVWVVKLYSNGTKQWQSLMGGGYGDYGYSIRQTADGYLVAGNTFSKNIETPGNDIGGIYAAKLNSSGTVLWQKVFGGSGTDWGSSMIPASDGGYILVGYSDSEDFATSQRYGNEDIVLMKLDTAGKQQWLKILGGDLYDRTGYDNVISQTSDGGYILTAQSTSGGTGDVAPGHGSNDAWVAKLFTNGSIQWQKSFGGAGCDVVGGISEISGGGYIFTAQAASSASGDVSDTNFGVRDVWVVRLDSSGNLLWEKLMGGSKWEQSTSIRETSDGGYIFAGLTSSTDSGYIGTSHGRDDAWVVKLNPRLVVDVMDAAETNMWVPNVTVILHDVTHNEDQNLSTLINGRVVFSDSGYNHQYRLEKGQKYSVKATADMYYPGPVVNITYAGDGQRMILNLTPLIANYTKSFSITCVENYDNMAPPTGLLDECDNVASNLIRAGYKMNFYHKDEEVIKENFAVDPSYTGHMLTESAFHYHSGHGTDPFNNSGTFFNTFLPLKNYAFHNITKGIGLVFSYDVKKKWGGKNKWVLLDSCYVLRDDDWNNALTTSHGILGYTSVSWVKADFGDTFFKYAFDKNETIVSAYKNATIVAYQNDNITAKAITRTLDQMNKDPFPGVGNMVADADPNSKKSFNLTWNCKSGVVW